jgi:hypothetical protein
MSKTVKIVATVLATVAVAGVGVGIYFALKKAADPSSKDSGLLGFSKPGSCGADHDISMTWVTQKACDAMGGTHTTPSNYVDDVWKWGDCAVGLCDSGSHSAVGAFATKSTAAEPYGTTPYGLWTTTTSGECKAMGGSMADNTLPDSTVVGCYMNYGAPPSAAADQRGYFFAPVGKCPAGTTKVAGSSNVAAGKTVPGCAAMGGQTDASGRCLFDVCAK